MSLADALLPEYDQEMTNTRKLLERVPEDRFDWRPHERSGTLGWLAGHVANLPTWAEIVVNRAAFDVEPPEGHDSGASRPTIENRAQLLEFFDTNVAETRDALASTSDEAFLKSWSLLKGGEELFEVPKIAAIRTFVLNHLIHHRGQLTVYLRLIGVPLPQIYGPTADEPEM